MKNQNIFKWLFVLAVLFTTRQNVNSQTLSTTNDRISLPTSTGAGNCPGTNTITSGVQNTGTACIFEGASTNRMRVWVWDGTLASLGWDHANATTVGNCPFTSITAISSTLHDPDVVVQNYNGNIYAMVVGEVVSGAHIRQIFWGSYLWTGTAFPANPNVSGFCGATNDTTANPNIDVNIDGKVVITWHKIYHSQVTITVGSPFSTTNTVSVQRGDIYSLYGNIDGTSGTCLNHIVANSLIQGDLVSQITNSSHILEMNLYPDVCLSDSEVVTFTWFQQWFDPNSFSIKSEVIAKQSGYCKVPDTLNTLNYYNLSFNGNPVYGQRPRIACPHVLTTAAKADFQVVIGGSTELCTCPVTCDSRILNWSKHNGSINTAVPFILNNIIYSLQPYYNSDPVVTYRDTSTNEYVVAWTAGDATCGNQGTLGGVDQDIIASTFLNGVNLFNLFSFVNEGTCAGNLNGDQKISSIDGRFLKNPSSSSAAVQYEFYDANKDFIGYKVATNRPGNGLSLREIDPDPGIAEDASESFNAQPNPFSNEILFNINVSTKNSFKIEVINSSGSLIKMIELNAGSKSHVWKTKDVKPGLYVARLIMPDKTYITRIIKN
ncbi:MAG TPA: T9SS type A sorting domain-containing protein [Bacteroidia bacterium]|nr:T9SS type A sorting domain-containing protein [Bacteroidia bacterium]